jgi:hypothetical protein
MTPLERAAIRERKRRAEQNALGVTAEPSRFQRQRRSPLDGLEPVGVSVPGAGGLEQIGVATPNTGGLEELGGPEFNPLRAAWRFGIENAWDVATAPAGLAEELGKSIGRGITKQYTAPPIAPEAFAAERQAHIDRQRAENVAEVQAKAKAIPEPKGDLWPSQEAATAKLREDVQQTEEPIESLRARLGFKWAETDSPDRAPANPRAVRLPDTGDPFPSMAKPFTPEPGRGRGGSVSVMGPSSMGDPDADPADFSEPAWRAHEELLAKRRAVEEMTTAPTVMEQFEAEQRRHQAELENRLAVAEMQKRNPSQERLSAWASNRVESEPGFQKEMDSIAKMVRSVLAKTGAKEEIILKSIAQQQAEHKARKEEQIMGLVLGRPTGLAGLSIG